MYQKSKHLKVLWKPILSTSVLAMSDPLKQPTSIPVATAVPTVSAVPVSEISQSAPAPIDANNAGERKEGEYRSPIEFITKHGDDDTKPTQFVIKIHAVECIRSIKQWMEEYKVMNTIKEWARQIQWKEQVWMPLKQWFMETDWKKFRREVKEGLDDVDWKEVKKEWKAGLDEVDWKDVKREVKGGLQEVDWKSVRKEMKDATREVDWKQVRKEIKDVAESVDWKDIKEDVDNTVDWEGVKDAATELCPDGIKDDKGKVDWIQVKRAAKELCPDDAKAIVDETEWKDVQTHARDICPEGIDCENICRTVAAGLSEQDEEEAKDKQEYVFLIKKSVEK